MPVLKSQLTPKQKLGKLGEQLAKKLLQNKGYIFLAQNFNSRFSEIDLIFKDKQTIVFVEVKTRVGEEYGPPEEAITPQKIRRLTKAAQYYLLKNDTLGEDFRLDAVAVLFGDITQELKYINHYQNISM